MKIGRYEFRAAKIQAGDAIRGYIEAPQGARLLYYGAAPDLKGNLCAWGEESSLALSPSGRPPMETHELVLLKHGHEIPVGFEYKGYILANPILLVYMRTAEAGGKNKLN